MKKVILLTGATDGIGKETAKTLVSQGHQVLLHGRNPTRLQTLQQELGNPSNTEVFVADLSNMMQVEEMAKNVSEKHNRIDVLINNAGVFKTSQVRTEDGLDVRFAVNTLAPYLLTKRLLPLIPAKGGRIVNLSSAAQASVNLEALKGKRALDDSSAYAQSKLGIAMWNYALSQADDPHNHRVFVAVNPASFLGSKMVMDAYGMQGKPLSIGASILVEAALSKKFERASGKYFDNDSGDFRSPHPDGTSKPKTKALVETMDQILADMGIQVN